MITGFGRLGAPFAAEYFGVTPDIMTTAKGLTNGALPMGAVFASRAIHDALMQGPENAIELFHGYTYSGHPAACAAALATLDIYEREGLLTRAGLAGRPVARGDHDACAARRTSSTSATSAWSPASSSAPRAGAPGARGYDLFVDCFEQGLLMRASGDTIALSPPLIVEPAQIDEMVAIIGEALKRLA